MSYALAFTGDARYDFAGLELQELALDELDRIAQSDAALSPTFTADAIQDMPGVRHYIFMRLAVDRQRHELVILGMYHHKHSSAS